mgnify:CR=1 FL=1
MIPFSPPRIDQKTIDEVTDTLLSGWITTGPKTKKFESRLTEYAGHKKTLCVSSGSAGLELMLRWFGVGNGDEVILPAYTYAATANVIIHCGATPVFVDVNKKDFNISVEEIKRHITPRTKVIMPVDLGGYPCDYDEINELVTQEKIKQQFNPYTEIQHKLGRILVMSDAAHSVGAAYQGKKTGKLTDITVYSFHAVKNLTTAEGGAVCLNLPDEFDHEALYKELNIKSLHGQSKDALAKFKVGNWRYDVLEAGYKYNMTDIQAAMGLVELQRYEEDMLKRRRQIFEKYTAAFEKHDWAEVPLFETSAKTSSFHAYLLRIRGIHESARDNIIGEIFRQEVSVNVHFIPLPMMTYYKKLGYDISDYPVAYDNFSREISLPVYYDLTDAQIETVIRAVVSSVEKFI